MSIDPRQGAEPLTRAAAVPPVETLMPAAARPLRFLPLVVPNDEDGVVLRLETSLRTLLPLGAAALLAGCDMVVLRPAGDIAARQGTLVVLSTLLMLLIIVPVIVLTLVFAWRYRQANTAARYQPDWDHSIQLELVIWAAPLLIIILLGAITWISTHTLDPYRALKRIDAGRALPPDAKPLTIEAVALDWKWLFIYPEQGIAVVNELAAPVDRPIRFRITSSSVMNSLFIPALAGQIYAMPGMQTSLHAVINQAGTWDGFSANYSGEGFSDMRFKFHGLAGDAFERWVQSARAAGGVLDRKAYLALEKPSVRDPVRRYASVAPDLYDAILDRCVAPGQTCLSRLMALDARRNLVGAAASAAAPGALVCRADDPIDSPFKTAAAVPAR
jgi:cytochrome o ubiquinol oxidase subunit 2